MQQINYKEGDNKQNNDHNKNKTLSILADDGDSDYYGDDNGDIFAGPRKNSVKRRRNDDVNVANSRKKAKIDFLGGVQLVKKISKQGTSQSKSV